MSVVSSSIKQDHNISLIPENWILYCKTGVCFGTFLPFLERLQKRGRQETWERRRDMSCSKGSQSDSDLGLCSYMACAVTIQLPWLSQGTTIYILSFADVADVPYQHICGLLFTVHKVKTHHHHVNRRQKMTRAQRTQHTGNHTATTWNLCYTT